MQDTDLNSSIQRRSGFEVAGWDGARWILEGIFENGVEAASEAKSVLARRLGVKVTQEVFNAAEGTFKSRVVFTEFRGPEPTKPGERKRPVELPQRTRQPSEAAAVAANDKTLLIATASLVISILAMLFALVR